MLDKWLSLNQLVTAYMSLGCPDGFVDPSLRLPVESSVILSSRVLACAEQGNAALYCTVLYCTVLYCNILYYTIIYYTIIYYTILCYTIALAPRPLGSPRSSEAARARRWGVSSFYRVLAFPPSRQWQSSAQPSAATQEECSRSLPFSILSSFFLSLET